MQYANFNDTQQLHVIFCFQFQLQMMKAGEWMELGVSWTIFGMITLGF
jgi:cytochrome c oxidase assembly protein Cox11